MASLPGHLLTLTPTYQVTKAKLTLSVPLSLVKVSVKLVTCQVNWTNQFYFNPTSPTLSACLLWLGIIHIIN